MLKKIQEFWHNDGHLNEDQRDFLISILSKKKPRYCLEIGFATGRSTITTLVAANPIKMISIDIDLDYMKAREHANMICNQYSQLSIIECSSHDILTEQFFHTEFPFGIDFALVDGDHTYSGCYSDLSIVYAYLNIGGIIAIDDYKSGPPNGASLPEVTCAIENFCIYNNIICQEWYKDGKGFAIICKE